jgi:heptosyltransferase-3
MPNPVNSTAGKILIIRGGAIGDFILTLPVFAALRQHLPKARLEVLGYPHIAQLAMAGGLADAMRSIEAGALSGFFARNGNLDAALQEYFASFAIIISYLYDPDQIFQTNVARCSKAQFIAGPHRPDEKGALHATEVFLGPLERLAIFDADPVPRLPLAGAREDTMLESIANPQGGNPPLLALHPGSGSERKNWPESKWSDLLQELTRTTTQQLLLVGGEAEEERLARLAKTVPASRLQLAKNLPLPILARSLTACRAFIGHDSGITHLAAAVGLPIIILWGDSMEAVWRPQAEKLRLLKNPQGLEQISVSRVQQELAQLIE